MKILRCIHSLDPAIGGPLESVKQSSRVLLARGHEVEVVSLDAAGSAWLEDFPAPVHALGPGRGSYGYAPRLVPWLKERHSRYDAVAVHGIWQYNSFGVWRALHKTDTPYFVFPHGMLDPWFKRTYPRKHLKKLLYWPWAEYRVLRDARAVLFTSEEERRLARESFALYRCHEVVVNYGTAAPEADLAAARAEFLQAFPALRETEFLLFLGRLHEKKGCEELLRAFANQSDSALRLVLAGPCADEEYLQRLRNLKNELGLSERVMFSGMLSGDLKWGAFAAAAAFILPSHQENFGIAVVEALACGTPVLISDQVNIWREIIEDGAGLADTDNVEGIGRLLERWQAMPPGKRSAMSIKAQRSFAHRFEIYRAVDSFLKVLQNQTGRKDDRNLVSSDEPAPN
ncbi:MAG: glycosyltransferase [Chthoniobacterales bacterium]